MAKFPSTVEIRNHRSQRQLKNVPFFIGGKLFGLGFSVENALNCPTVIDDENDFYVCRHKPQPRMSVAHSAGKIKTAGNMRIYG